MSKIKKYLNENNNKLNIKDYITILVIVILYGVFSFINLGSNICPNTFYNIHMNEELLFEFNNIFDISKIKTFSGNYGSYYKVYSSVDGEEYNEVFEINNSCFTWKEDNINTYGKYIKFVFTKESSLGEVYFYDNLNRIENINIKDYYGDNIYTLDDELNTNPKKISYLNSSYFDEVFFARSAYEYANNLQAFEWTHPPLGKIIQAIPLFITHHLSTFNYRFMGNLSGILMLVIMYLFGIELFKKRKFAITSSLIMALDTFHFAQTRMGTVDSHLVLFIITSSYFMIRFINSNKIRYLFLSGLFFSLSCSIKWTGLYVGIALCILYFYYMFKNKLFNIKYISYGFMFFIVLPLIIYCSSFLLFPNNYYYTNNLKNIYEEQKVMYNFHSNLKEDHTFASKWYTWPLSYKPVWYYSEEYNNTRGTITGVGNLVIWWFGIIAFIYSIIMLIIKKKKINKNILILIIFILSLLLPYMFIKRVMFLYHYFPVLPFVMLITVNMFYDLDKKNKLKLLLPEYLILSLLFFIIFYPVVSGLEVSSNYIDKLNLFSEWHF